MCKRELHKKNKLWLFISVNGGLYNSSDYIYPDSTLKLTCNPPENNGITWKMNNNKLVTSDKYTVDNLILTVNRVTPADSGKSEKIL